MDVAPSLYEGIFLGTLSTCVLPLPEESTLLAAGYVARLGRVNLAGAVLAAWCAVMVGDVLGYAIGRFVLASLLGTRLGQRIVPDRWRLWGEDLVRRYGDRAVFLGRFLVGVRGFVYFAVGAARLSFLRFLAVNGVAAVLDVGAIVGVGFAFGELRARSAGAARGVDIGVAVVLAVTLVGPVLVRSRGRTKRAETGNDKLSTADGRER